MGKTQIRTSPLARLAHCSLRFLLPKRVKIHGFSDAIETAYSACIYLRSVDARGKVFVHLLCAKTKVAPLKSLTIPKLELSAIVVLVKLIKKVTDSLNIPIHRILSLLVRLS